MVAYFLYFLRKGRPHYKAQCLLELGFDPLFLLGRGLPLKLARLAAGASFLGQLVGWPNSFTLAALQGEFFRESSHPPTPSIRLMACPFPEGEGDAQQVLGLEESASHMSGFLILTEIQSIHFFLWGWSVQSAQEFQIARIPCRPLLHVCEAASLYEPHQGHLVVRLGPGVNSREITVGKCHMVDCL